MIEKMFSIQNKPSEFCATYHAGTFNFYKKIRVHERRTGRSSRASNVEAAHIHIRLLSKRKPPSFHGDDERANSFNAKHDQRTGNHVSSIPISNLRKDPRSDHETLTCETDQNKPPQKPKLRPMI
mmetsp:Transcript_16071/g.32379  ORF Transcript_16071/g.32379 Transcript_16071/m.32379 type:complete len:125 (-) Transcript_16071:2157-2531(-)